MAFQQLNPSNTAYNVPAAFWIKGKLNVDTLVERLVTHHDVLHSHFEDDQGIPFQVAQSQLPLPIEQAVFNDFSDQNLTRQKVTTLAEHTGRIFILKPHHKSRV